MLQHSIPNEHLMQIGDITVSFALLEFVMKSIVGNLLSKDIQIGEIITSEMPFKGIRVLALSLYIKKYGKDEEYNNLNRLMKLTSKIEERRNQIMHSMWAVGKDTNHIVRIKSSSKESKGLQYKVEEMSEMDLKATAIEIQGVAGDLSRFWLTLLMKQ
jgi:hypothetical protein